MSTVSRSRAPKSPEPEGDPSRHGRRYIRVVNPDGSETLDQVPLTLRDGRFPEVGGSIARERASSRGTALTASSVRTRPRPVHRTSQLQTTGIDPARHAAPIHPPSE